MFITDSHLHSSESLDFIGLTKFTPDNEIFTQAKIVISKDESDSLFQFVELLRKGDGVPVDKSEAIKYYKISIEKGNDNAMFNYANMLKKGDGVPVDKSEAIKYYKM